MVIDCTLNALKIPGFPEFIPAFGTKKENGAAVTAREANENMLLPYNLMRPREVAENSSTSEIQANVCFNFTVGGITLDLGSGAYTGCKVTAVNSASAAVTVLSGSLQFAVHPAAAIHLEYIGNNWVMVSDQSESFGALALALDYAALAAREHQKTIRQRIQTGTVTIANRGVISGCTVTKSSNAVRNISLAAGTFFLQAKEIACPAFINTSLVPPNSGSTAQTCWAYIYLDNDSRTVQFACTPFGEPIPEGGLPLYRFTVPAGNTEVNDPYLTSVTMTDVRRLEAGYPIQFNSISYTSAALPWSMGDANYEVMLDVVGFKGGTTQRQAVYASDKTANGFRVYAEGSLDEVTVRWTAMKIDL